MPNAKFYHKHKERLKKQEAERYVRERERILARNKAWNAAHSEYMNKLTKDWAEANPERRTEISKKSHKNHKAARNAFCREYQKRNPELFLAKGQKRRTAKTKAGGSFTAQEWVALCKKHAYRCLCCNRRRKLTADHVVPVSKGGTSNINNIQPLCGPCNSSKRDKTIDYRREP
jgi:5-methylcytosine-specific restriction endonuclease McrA